MRCARVRPGPRSQVPPAWAPSPTPPSSQSVLTSPSHLACACACAFTRACLRAFRSAGFARTRFRSARSPPPSVSASCRAATQPRRSSPTRSLRTLASQARRRSRPRNGCLRASPYRSTSRLRYVGGARGLLSNVSSRPTSHAKRSPPPSLSSSLPNSSSRTHARKGPGRVHTPTCSCALTPPPRPPLAHPFVQVRAQQV